MTDVPCDETAVEAEELFALIRSRRSAGKLDRDRVPSREAIEHLLQACTYAPNHHMTQPWRFTVISGNARDKMGELFQQLMLKGVNAPSEETLRQARLAARKPLRAPVIVLVACETEPERSRRRKEDYAACAAGVQNMLLLAHSMGLAAKWSTGGLIDDERFKHYYGLKPTDEVVAMLYIGYADALPPLQQRRPLEEVTLWMD
ncbi:MULTISPECIES: nitroreductase [Marinobacter]|uniref:nitroreductase family protein n=1 Tax=Marinobacter TaxID=2742 RepID=UPI001785B2B8|nr:MULTISPECIES: nitroreductase [Marinobacter]MBJ7275785.1 nitroreductase [Marinobacter salarius]MBL3559003.1 nitroreductase [Marinobacter sp. JB05H06]